MKYLSNCLALHRIDGVGPVKFQQHLIEDPNLTTLPSWVKPNWHDVSLDLKWQQQKNCHIITYIDPQYPKILKSIPNPPAVLFVKGNTKVLQSQKIAIVGTRHPSPQGFEIAYNFAKYFTKLDFTITSGLAIGIDTASHKGSIEHGKTIAVLACGLDKIYPAKNKHLAQQIIDKGGAIISEFPIGTMPKAGNFHSRNRIISGLSIGVLVVEAAIISGALITANLAASQNREVFAIPGSIYNAKSKGCHKLIKQGAKLVESADDVLEELQFMTPKINTKRNQYNNLIISRQNIELTEEENFLLPYINNNTTSIDEIIINSKISVQQVNNILIQLELKGAIAAVPGGYIKILNYESLY